MAKKKAEQEEEHHLEGSGGMRWLLTYADMITLLLGLFIILASISTADQGKFNNIAGQAAQVFSAARILPMAGGDKVLPGGTGVLPYVKPEKKAKLTQEQLNSGLQRVSVVETESGTLITLSSGILFDPGSAELKPDARDVIDQVYKDYLEQSSLGIIIKGHTDTQPISNLVFPSNWELSSARAGTVARYLIHRWGVKEDRITTAGYSSTVPVAPNLDEEGRAMNRRVEIYVMKNVVPVEKSESKNKEKSEKNIPVSDIKTEKPPISSPSKTDKSSK